MTTRMVAVTAGILLSALILTEHLMGWRIGVFSSVATMALLVLSVSIVVPTAFLKNADDPIRQAFKSGLSASVILGGFAAISVVILHHWLHPEFIEEILVKTREVMSAESASEEDIKAALALKKKMFSPFVLMATTLFKLIFSGGLLSLIVTGIMVVIKRK